MYIAQCFSTLCTVLLHTLHYASQHITAHCTMLPHALQNASQRIAQCLSTHCTVLHHALNSSSQHIAQCFSNLKLARTFLRSSMTKEPLRAMRFITTEKNNLMTMLIKVIHRKCQKIRKQISEQHFCNTSIEDFLDFQNTKMYFC